MRFGKLTSEELNYALGENKKLNKEVLIGCGIGEDCAVIENCGKLLITTDPITAKCGDIAQLLVDINANDIYASGGIPKFATLTVIAPPHENVQKVLDLIKNIIKKANDCGIDIIGGHTEFSDVVNRILASMTMIGSCDRIISNKNCKSGQKIIVTKFLGIEGSQILIKQHDSLKKIITNDEIEELFNENISVKNESLALIDCKLSAMHDITEGGIYGAVCEVANACGLGAILYKNELPYLKATQKVCEKLQIDGGGLISSGSMMIVSEDYQSTLKILANENIKATVVGEFKDASGVFLRDEKGFMQEVFMECDKLFTVDGSEQ